MRAGQLRSTARLQAVVLKPILTEDSLDDFQRRVNKLKSLKICVPTDSIGQIQKYNPGLASSMAVSRDFFNCSCKIVFRPDFDLSSASQSASPTQPIPPRIAHCDRTVHYYDITFSFKDDSLPQEHFVEVGKLLPCRRNEPRTAISEAWTSACLSGHQLCAR